MLTADLIPHYGMICSRETDIMSLLSRIFFNVMYYSRPPWDTGISPPELLAYIQANPAGKAIDMGCGTGTNVITLAKNGWQVTGIDYTPRAIALARDKVQKAGVKADLRVGNVTRLSDISGPFDLVFDLGCFHSLNREERIAYIQNLPRLLAVNGAFLLYAFTTPHDRTGPGITPTDEKDLNDLFKLESRQDGDFLGRASAWFTFRNVQSVG